MVAAKKSKVQGQAPKDDDAVMAVVGHGGSAAARAASGTKRAADDGSGAAGPAQRRMQHGITGVNKDFRDKVQTALSDLELTKDVAELQAVMDQVTKVTIELQKLAGEQEAKVVLMGQRLDAFDPTVDKMDRDLRASGSGWGTSFATSTTSAAAGRR